MKNSYNREFKEKVKATGISLCELGFQAGLSEPTLFRWLRYPLSTERESALLNTLETITSNERRVQYE